MGIVRLVGGLKEALQHTRVVLVVVPGWMQHSAAGLLAGFLRPEHVVVLVPGGLLGSLAFASAIWDAGARCRPTVCETSCKLHVGESLDGTEISVAGRKDHVLIAAFPAERISAVCDTLQDLLPGIETTDTVLETGLSNLNTFLHVAKAVCNAGLIERRVAFSLFREGLTPGIARVEEALDKERISLGKALGIRLRSVPELVLQHYGGQGAIGTSMYDVQRANPVWERAVSPDSLVHRFLTEDVPYGLVPMESLCSLARTPHDTTTALIQLASVLVGEDLRSVGRTLRGIVSCACSVDCLLELMRTGMSPAQ